MHGRSRLTAPRSPYGNRGSSSEMDKVNEIQRLAAAGLNAQAGLLATTLQRQEMREMFRALIDLAGPQVLPR